MSISNFREIGLRIGFAILRDETLRLDYNSVIVEARGDELYEAWANLDLTDPFTILEEGI